MSLYRREVIWVSMRRDGAVHRQVLGKSPDRFEWSDSDILSSIAVAVVQTRPDGSVNLAAREDSPFFDFQPTKIALDHLEITDLSSITMLATDAFDEFATAFSSGLNSVEAVRRLLPLIERHAPSFRFMPRHLHHLIEPMMIDGTDMSFYYKNLPRSFLRYDFRDYEAIAWINRTGGQISPKLFQKWKVDSSKLLHIGGAWYAFHNIDDAVSLKFQATATEIYRIKDD